MTASTTATTIPLVAGYGATMPAVPYFMTFTPPGQLSTLGNSEIVLVSARSADSLTVVRGQKGTTAKSIGTGWLGSASIIRETSTAVGDIITTLNATPQTGRLFMAGGTYNKSDYPLLYDHVVNNPGYGTTTSTTFTLKDMRQRFPIGLAASGTGSSLGGTGGTIDHKHKGYGDGDGYGNGDLRATVGSASGDASSLNFQALDAINPNTGGGMGNGTYKVVGANHGSTGFSHFTKTVGYTSGNNPPFIAVNFEVIAG
jgi:hypothetical protein